LDSLHRTGAVLLLGAGLVTGSAVPAALAAPADGYVRLAHLSPDTPAVDVYLYSLGKKTPRLVLRHVGYGALSPYQRLGTGAYTVAMRPADAAAASPPVLSTNVRVAGGQAYTVAGVGPYKGIKLQVLEDSASIPAGRAGLRVIEASLKEPTVDVTAGGRGVAKNLRFAGVTPYRSMPAKPATVKVTGGSGSPVHTKVSLMAGSIHTVVVLDGASGLKLLDLVDTAGGKATPRGGIDTGLGGLAPSAHRGIGSWSVAAATLAGLAGLAGLAALGALALGLVRLRRRA
jgi:hypothetical protein